MSSTVRATLQLDMQNLAVQGSAQSDGGQDPGATTHDYVDPVPLNVATGGAIGSVFVPVRTSVVQVERLFAMLAGGTDVVVRTGGAPAVVTGGSSAPSFAGGETAVIAVDGGSNVTVTFAAGDTTLQLAAARINFFLGAQIAAVVSGVLVLTGARTGGADAKAKGYGYGALAIVSGSALAALGLSVGTTYGSGDDERVAGGPFAKTFPPSGLPKLVELSGSATNARLWVAGKAA